MGSRGKSTATIKALSTIPKERIKPPKHLTATQKRIWRSIVEELPETHFIKADSTLLETYVVGVALLRVAAQRIENPDAEDITFWTKILENQQTRLGNLAVKLRLTPSGRMRSDTLKIEDKPVSSRKLS